MGRVIKSSIQQLAKLLKKKKLTLVTAESCTGGGLSYWIALEPSCSSFLDRCFVTYSEDAKKDLLGITEAALKKFGPVSEEIVVRMAKGALKNSNADIAVAITGLAGPKHDGESDEPVGAVYISCCDKKKQLTLRKQFKGGREVITEKSIAAAINLLLEFIIHK